MDHIVAVNMKNETCDSTSNIVKNENYNCIYTEFNVKNESDEEEIEYPNVAATSSMAGVHNEIKTNVKTKTVYIKNGIHPLDANDELNDKPRPSWSNKQILLLIELIKQHPCLYEVKHRYYHNRNVRKSALQDIAKSLNNNGNDDGNVSTTDILKKWTGLRNTYTSERRKYLLSLESGSGENDVYKPSLWYFEKLIFLNDQLTMTARQPKSNCSVEKKEIQKMITTEENTVSDDGRSSSVMEKSFELNLTENKSSSNYGDSKSNDTLSETDSVSFSPSQSIKSQKRKLIEEVEDKTYNEEINYLKRVSSTLSNTDRSLNEYENALYGKILAQKLNSIKNPLRKLKTMKAIDDILYEVLIAELDD